MLNELEVTRVWDNLLAAEARSLYFGDLAARYTNTKQIITGVSFFCSSGAAAALIGKLPPQVAIILSLIVAAATAYSIAVGLDRKVATMAKLLSSWKLIALDYEKLWNNVYSADAGVKLQEILKSEEEPADLATTEAPNDQKLLGKWQDRVFSLHRVADQNV